MATLKGRQKNRKRNIIFIIRLLTHQNCYSDHGKRVSLFLAYVFPKKTITQEYMGFKTYLQNTTEKKQPN